MKILIVDKQKNTIKLDLSDLNEDQRQLFWSTIDTNKIKRNKNKRELNNEIGKFLKENNNEKNNNR